MSEITNTVRSLASSMSSVKEKNDLNSLVYGRVQPQATQLEEAILGAIMLDKDGLPSVIEILRPESFYIPAHHEIYDVMPNLFSKSQPIDLLTLHEEFTKHKNLMRLGELIT